MVGQKLLNITIYPACSIKSVFRLIKHGYSEQYLVVCEMQSILINILVAKLFFKQTGIIDLYTHCKTNLTLPCQEARKITLLSDNFWLGHFNTVYCYSIWKRLIWDKVFAPSGFLPVSLSLTGGPDGDADALLMTGKMQQRDTSFPQNLRVILIINHFYGYITVSFSGILFNVMTFVSLLPLCPQLCPPENDADSLIKALFTSVTWYLARIIRTKGNSMK